MKQISQNLSLLQVTRQRRLCLLKFPSPLECVLQETISYSSQIAPGCIWMSYRDTLTVCVLGGFYVTTSVAKQCSFLNSFSQLQVGSKLIRSCAFGIYSYSVPQLSVLCPRAFGHIDNTCPLSNYYQFTNAIFEVYFLKFSRQE